MQWLCQFHRAGYRIRNPRWMVEYLVGLLHHENDKVRRWSLNSLGLLGTKREVKAILDVAQRDRDKPDILASGVAAVAALAGETETRVYLRSIDIPLEGATLLGALQQSGAFRQEAKKLRVNIERASEPELRFAAILLGIGNAPENMFSSKFANRKVIGQLNRHPDQYVAQYSVWAIHENRRMGLRDLGIRLSDIESQSPNVRKYVYRLIARETETAKKNYELLVVGSEDSSVDAREGLAIGIRNLTFDPLQELVLDWYADEESDLVRKRLLEHMATTSDKVPAYTTPVISAYESAPRTGLARAQLESAARGTAIYQRMKRIDLEADVGDLFGKSKAAILSTERRRETPTRGTTVGSFNPSKAYTVAQNAQVLVVTALPKEAAAIKATFDDRDTFGDPADPFVYEIGTYFVSRQNSSRHVILASANMMGKANASTVAANALRTFGSVTHIIMAGIAGGCPNHNKVQEHVRLGDIVIGTGGVLEYDNIKEFQSIRQIRGTTQRPSARLLGVAGHLQSEEMLKNRPWDKFLTAALTKLDSSYARPNSRTDVLHEGSREVPHPDDPTRFANLPRVHTGVVGTADTLLKNPGQRDRLRDDFGIRAIEMEASGIQTASWAQGKDIFVVRGICDYCDEYKNDDWQNYAALAAAAYTRALIEAMPVEWFKSES